MATSLCSKFHGGYDNHHFDPTISETCANPPMFSARIETNIDLTIALARAELEPEKLAFLECCIEPNDISRSLHTFGMAIGGETKRDENGHISKE